MAYELFKNFAQTTTTASINNTSNPVTFSVSDPTTFPSGGNFRIIIGSEILLVTSVSGSNFTASRAQEGTSIASHSSGSVITHILTAQSLKNIVGDFNLVDTYSNRPTAGVPGRIFRTTTSPGVYWRDNGTTWDMYFNDYGPLNPSISDFTTWVNQSSTTATVDFTNGIYTLSCASDANTNGRTEDLALRVKTAPSTPWTLTIAMRIRCAPGAAVSAGLVTRDSGTGHITALAITPAGGVAFIWRWNDPQSFSGNPWNSTNAATVIGSQITWLRVVNDGTNFVWSFSFDGIQFHRVYTEAVSGAFVATCNTIGFYLNYQNRNISGTPIPPASVDVLHALVT